MNGYSFIEINDGSDRTVTGIIAYDRNNGGRLLIPAGAAFPAGGTETAGELFYRTDTSVLYVRNTANTTWEPIQSNPAAHAATHIKDGSDEIDGDQLDIDFTPSNYTPSTAPAEASDVDHLSAHLAGIDNALANTGGFNDLATASNTNTQTTTATYNAGGALPAQGLTLRSTLNATVTQAGGLYLIVIYYTWNHNGTTTDFIAQLVEEDPGGTQTSIYFHRQEPQDAAGSLLGTGTNQVMPASFGALRTLAAGTHFYRLYFGNSGTTASSIILSHMTFYRLS